MSDLTTLVAKMRLYPKFLLFIVVSIVTVYGSENQNFGLIIYHSNKWDNSIIKTHGYDIYNNGLYSLADLNFGPFKIFNSMFATPDSLAARKGGFKKVKGIYGYTNRAFIETHFEIKNVKNDVLFGRDYQFIGHGKLGSLFLGKDSRPFDQFSWKLNYSNIFGSVGIIQIENFDQIRRYLSYHTLGFSNEKLSITLAESILYTGAGRSLEWQYLNPVLFWVPEMVNNSTGDGNGFLYGGFKYNHSTNFSFWTELIIDDYQVNHESKGDLEPNEIGFLTGIEKNSWPFKSSVAWLEYTMVKNRTYQTPNPTEIYTHRGFPIGHYLGNDFDMFQFYYSQKNMNQKLKPYISVSYLRDGANGLDTPFDRPWMDDSAVTLGTGYSEPFPTGPVRTTTEMEVAADYELKNGSLINAGLLYSNGSSSTATSSGFSFVLRLWLTFGKSVQY